MSQTMQDLVKQAGPELIPFKEGKIIEVEILAKSQKRILVDVQGLNLGIITEKEFSSDFADLEKGDKVLAYVLMTENDEGYIVLSLKKAERERFHKSLIDKFKAGEAVIVRTKEANRGGLIVEYGREEGFLPSSQLASSHYPRVGNDREKILVKLKELVGQNIKAKIITYEPSAGKIIFSEKEAGDSLLEEKLAQFKVGDVKEGVITGVVNFGLFVDVEGIEGLVHISEASWDKVENINKLFQVGEKIKTKIISIDDHRLSLSVKKLTPDPWIKAIKDYKSDQEIKGKVIKITPFGAFVEITKDLNGLIHVSELNKERVAGKKSPHIEEALELGKEYQFKIISIEPEAHKINLTLISKSAKSAKKGTKRDKKTKKK